MRSSFVYVLCLFCVGVSARVFDTRCKLVRELIRAGMPNDLFLGQWVCLIEKESNRNTAAYTESSSGKKYYGLYQIPNKWCREGKKGGDCNIACESLLDEDIRDDTACAVTIFHKEGFKYWPKWTTRCKNDNFITTEIYKCPDLNTRQSPELERSESLRRRRKQVRVGMERYLSNIPKSHMPDYLFIFGQAIPA